MATIDATSTRIQNRALKVDWSPLANGDDGNPLVGTRGMDTLTVQVLGTFSTGGTVQIQGSNDGGTTWHALNDPQGNTLEMTAAGIKAVQERPEQVRPAVTGGDVSTSLTVIAVAQ